MFPDLTFLNQKINEFTLSHQKTQAEVIALLKTQNLLLTQILEQIKNKKLCQD